MLENQELVPKSGCANTQTMLQGRFLEIVLCSDVRDERVRDGMRHYIAIDITVTCDASIRLVDVDVDDKWDEMNEFPYDSVCMTPAQTSEKQIMSDEIYLLYLSLVHQPIYLFLCVRVTK